MDENNKEIIFEDSIIKSFDYIVQKTINNSNLNETK